MSSAESAATMPPITALARSAGLPPSLLKLVSCL